MLSPAVIIVDNKLFSKISMESSSRESQHFQGITCRGSCSLIILNHDGMHTIVEASQSTAGITKEAYI